jgi:hypothetical protein
MSKYMRIRPIELFLVRSLTIQVVSRMVSYTMPECSKTTKKIKKVLKLSKK